VVGAPDSLGDDLRDVEHVQPGAEVRLVVVLRHAVGRDELVDAAALDAVERVAAEYAVRDKRVDVSGALLFEELGGADDLGMVSMGRERGGGGCSVRREKTYSVTGVDEIVDQDADAL
jgi:hypothetical protein